MVKLLYIKASPRERSHSVKVADEFVNAYSTKNPRDEVLEIDLFKKDLPAFDEKAVNAKYTILHGKKHSDEENMVWMAIQDVINEFKSADKYLFAVPMWNFGIPYRLKQYFDIIVQPGYTFSFTPEQGYKGLLTGKKAFCVFASGGDYSKGTPAASYDQQKPYVKQILGFIGITDVKDITIAPTLAGGPEIAKKKDDEGMRIAKQIADTF